MSNSDSNSGGGIAKLSIAGKVIRKGAEMIVIFKANGKLYQATDFNNELMDAYLQTGDADYLNQLEAEIPF